MKKQLLSIIVTSSLFLSACGTLDNKTILIDHGASKKDVMEIMGTPQDRQMKGPNEAWQYCKSGSSFGANDHKIIWFYKGKVTGINTYRTSVSGCTGGIRSISWSEAPDYTIEHRIR
ncbi:hypothetical protein LZS85_04540 [Aliivibrio fischeri]|uniref:hypothetical protein n=1 Tax=Aliivibrio fischeri TaxID=668 RepID=UPI000907F92D|nr:hypothetical protein [Aliivibrio fischeri]MCE7565367.1 hypothetical protein [Aliivibrio fischeri]